MMRIAVRTAPTNYEYYANPASSYGDLSGGGYTFPLLGNFSAGRMIFNVEVTASEHNGTEADLYAKILAKIEDNNLLRCIVFESHVLPSIHLVNVGKEYQRF